MSRDEFSIVVEKICDKDQRYEFGAYAFIREALDFTMRESLPESNGPSHVSGKVLLDGIRTYALDRYGPMTKVLFKEWGVSSCEDFGEIVFNLVDAGVLGKTEGDRKEDFQGGFDFAEAFERPFLPERKLNN